MEAVKYVDSPVLIFAGAGSGKTRVLAYKIAYLIKEKGLSPEHILAVTFTNKAAREMRSRIDGLLRQRKSRSKASSGRTAVPGDGCGVHVGTFHSSCAHILRHEIHRLGYKPDFVIYDADDQLRLLKQILEQNDYDLDMYPPQTFQSRISYAKNRTLGPEQLEGLASGIGVEILGAVYKEYQQSLKRNNALDFDDLLLLPLTLFKKHPSVLKRYQEQYQYVLVDEYQDTNNAQFEFVRYLAKKHRNICAVGDDDQSIYTWRGADITNILNFERVFNDAKVFKLEQNYRSTPIILKAAAEVVAHNQSRAAKTLWTEREGGELIHIYPATDERDEAESVYRSIQHEVLVEKRRFRDMVILYRTNAQSRALEDALRRRTMAYTIVGGTKYYDRKEVKDVLAYLRLLVNPSDSVSLERIINFPPRSIGDTSMNRLRAYAKEKNLTPFEALKYGQKAGVQPKQSEAMKEFKALIERYQTLATTPAKSIGIGSPIVGEYTGGNVTQSQEKIGIEELVATLLEETGILHYYRRLETMDARDRLDNIEELIRSISQFYQENETATLRDFLEEVSLLTDIDRWNDDTNAVTLMTLHSAKGLEFPVVFLTGLEEGLFPLIRSDEIINNDEEERRLFYVGLTRAMEKVYLSYATQRRRWGSNMVDGVMSRFIRELPEELLVWPTQREVQEGVHHGQHETSVKKGVRPSGAKAPAIEAILDDYVVGAWVEHKIFGKGQIAGREGVGDNLKLTVRFNDGKEKKLVARYANLNRL